MRATALIVLALAGCSHLAEACPSGMQNTWRAEFLFGRNIGGALGVSDSDWRSFVGAEIAPRFPTGFTVYDAAGMWRGDDGSAVHEPSKIVVVLAPSGSETRARLDAIAAAYKVRFRQEAVGVVVAPACASF